MEDNKKLYPSLPSNYVTIVDLQKRWMQQKQQQQEEEEPVKRDIYEQDHNVLSNNCVHNEVVKPCSQFQKFNRSISDVKPNFKARGTFRGKFCGKKLAEEFQVVKKASDSSGINADTTNHIIIKEDGDCKEKNSRFQESNCSNSDGNPNFDNRKPFYRNFNSKRRLKEFPVVKNVSNTVPEKSMANVAITTTEFDDQKVKDEEKKKNKKKTQKVVDECCEDGTREKKGEKLVIDQTVEETDNPVIVEGQMAEEKDSQVIVEEQTAEIELKFKEVSVSRFNRRSTAVIQGKRRGYGGYRRGHGNGSWKVEKGKSLVVDQVSGTGRSAAEVERWRGVHRGYSGVGNTGKEKG